MSHRKAKAEEFIEKTYVQESARMREVRQRLAADGKEGINVSAHEGKILQMLVKMTRAKHILEVGTLYGYSALWMAAAMEPGGKLITLEIDPRNARSAREAFAQTDFNIEVIEGPALQSMQKLQGSYFDFIFIDANKAGYADYLRLAMDMLLPGGLVVGDNTFLFGHMYDEPFDFDVTESSKVAMRTFHKMLANDPRFLSTTIPTHQGLSVGLRL